MAFRPVSFTLALALAQTLYATASSGLDRANAATPRATALSGVGQAVTSMKVDRVPGHRAGRR
jgi:hypothetical protein